jgi:hypothetical protein
MCIRIAAVAATTLVAASLPMAAYADPAEWPVVDGGNGHYYEVVAADGISWDTANVPVLTVNLGSIGLRGYLATLTSPAENTHVDGLR